MRSRFADYFNRMSADERKYALEKVVYHLSHAILGTLSLGLQPEQRHLNKLHGLLTDPAWMEAHLVEDGHHHDFLNEVQMAWQVADKTGLMIEQTRPKMIARQVHYALLRTSVNSLASNMPSSVLLTGLQLNRWSAMAALEYARGMMDRTTRISTSAKIGIFLWRRQEVELADETFNLVLTELLELDQMSQQVKTLMELAPYLSPNLLKIAVEITGRFPDIPTLVLVLKMLAPHLSPKLISEAFDIMRKVDNADDQIRVLVGLVPYLPQNLLKDALEVVRAGRDFSIRAKGIGALAPYLPPELIPQALDIAQTIYDLSYRTAALMSFPQYRQSDDWPIMLRQALTAAQKAFTMEDCAEGVAMLAPHLPEELLLEALIIARSIGDGELQDRSCRSRALAALAPYLPASLQAEVIAEVRKWAIRHFSDQNTVLVAFAPYLPKNLIPVVLLALRETIQEIYVGNRPIDLYPSDQVSAVLTALAPYIPSALMTEALAVVNEIKRGDARGYALAVLVPYLSEDLLSVALDMARQMDVANATSRTMVLAALSLRGDPSLLDEALRTAEQIQESDESVVSLPILLASSAPVFPPKERQEVLSQALLAAREIYVLRYRADALARIAKYFPLEQRQAVLDEAVTMAYEVQDPLVRITCLCHTLPHLPDEQIPRIVADMLQDAQRMDFGEDVPNSLIAQALLLPPLAPFLSSDLLKEALVAVQSISNLPTRCCSLVMLAPYLSIPLNFEALQEALKAAREIHYENTIDRVRSLALIALHLPSDQRLSVVTETLRTAQQASVTHRRDLGPILAPLIPYLPSELYSEALVLARTIRSAHMLAAFAACTPSFEPPVTVAEALAAAQAIGSAAERARILTTLMPVIELDHRWAVLNTVLPTIQHVNVLDDWLSQVQVFRQLVPVWAYLRREQAYELWLSLLYKCSKHRRAYFLTELMELIPAIKALGKEVAITEVMHAVLEVCRYWSWVYNRPS